MHKLTLSLCTFMLLNASYGLNILTSVATGNKLGYGKIGLLIPLIEQKNSIFFMSGIGMINTKQAKETNIGIGYRKQVSNSIYGMYMHYDIRQQTTMHQQINLGFEYFYSEFSLRLNSYIATTQSINADSSKAEIRVLANNVEVANSYTYKKAVSGYDVEIGYQMRSLSLYAGHYHFEKMNGVRLRSSTKLSEKVSISAEYNYDNIRLHRYFFGLEYALSYGNHGKASNYNPMRSLPVRDLDIILIDTQRIKKAIVSGPLHTVIARELGSSDTVEVYSNEDIQLNGLINVAALQKLHITTSGSINLEDTTINLHTGSSLLLKADSKGTGIGTINYQRSVIHAINKSIFNPITIKLFYNPQNPVATTVEAGSSVGAAASGAGVEAGSNIGAVASGAGVEAGSSIGAAAIISTDTIQGKYKNPKDFSLIRVNGEEYNHLSTQHTIFHSNSLVNIHPYMLVNTPEDLNEIDSNIGRYYPSTKTRHGHPVPSSKNKPVFYAIGRDINMLDVKFNPIAINQYKIAGLGTLIHASYREFYGEIHGQGYRISNLNIDNDISNGMFAGFICRSIASYIHDIDFMNIKIKGHYEQNNVGIFAHITETSIHNINATGDINLAKSGKVGSIVGYATKYNSIANVKFSGNIRGTTDIHIGGLVGYMDYNNSLVDSVVSASISMQYDQSNIIQGTVSAGGFVGSLSINNYLANSTFIGKICSDIPWQFGTHVGSFMYSKNSIHNLTVNLVDCAEYFTVLQPVGLGDPTRETAETGEGTDLTLSMYDALATSDSGIHIKTMHNLPYTYIKRTSKSGNSLGKQMKFNSFYIATEQFFDEAYLALHRIEHIRRQAPGEQLPSAPIVIQILKMQATWYLLSNKHLALLVKYVRSIDGITSSKRYAGAAAATADKPDGKRLSKGELLKMLT